MLADLTRRGYKKEAAELAHALETARSQAAELACATRSAVEDAADAVAHKVDAIDAAVDAVIGKLEGVVDDAAKKVLDQLMRLNVTEAAPSPGAEPSIHTASSTNSDRPPGFDEWMERMHKHHARMFG